MREQLKHLGFLGFFCGFLLFSGLVFCKGIERTHDLQADGVLASQQNSIIILMISSENCPYCELIKREILDPMLLDKSDQRQYLVRELHIDMGETTLNFKGKSRASDSVAWQYGASLTPTLLFLSGKGRVLHKKMIGITTPELYPFYLNDAIDLSIQRLGLIP